ncbi:MULTISPECIES: AAA family ATPase [Paraburkholderia]|uniref:AAA family ATPase n=1 Tax=Paraburkholderia podalyriae TaxID=1938811 RepID=A0ABR7PFE6_9BURK|nr:AAA family ATPase [Paraburkholderia podalyriae]MBC8745099.1 AAA family ATPase [Paraburkholderia podalyriae]
MSEFWLRHLHLEQYRCFEALDLDLEPNLTVLFAENGGGKSGVLNALAMGLTAFQSGVPRGLRLDPQRDARKVSLDERGRREPAGTCTVKWTAQIGALSPVCWSSTANPASNRKSADHRQVLDAMEQVRVPGARWPLFAFYGADRMGRAKASTKPAPIRPDRWEGYAGSLNPSQDDSALLTWLLEEILADTVRRQEGEVESFLATAVMDTVAKATPGVSRAWYDPRERSPVVRFETGHVAPWQELSDGFHVYLALVADIARRAVMLNEQDGGEAPALVEGVVMIDEIDLHLHPRWQRVVLDCLRETFPRLQFIVTTHSPQVLSSVENRQVRRLVMGKLQEQGLFVEGRDSNAILRELMGTNDRDAEGQAKLRALHDAIDQGAKEQAEALYAELLALWGDLDPALIRARGLMEWDD